tara:strand:+ start:778 stop:990 length:213 start_codon:yes stop_codon:yes gene_type:complete
MARLKAVDGVIVELTQEEEAMRDVEEAQAIVEIETRQAAASAKQVRLDSVKSKLEALGLTTDEVKDAFGL